MFTLGSLAALDVGQRLQFPQHADCLTTISLRRERRRGRLLCFFYPMAVRTEDQSADVTVEGFPQKIVDFDICMKKIRRTVGLFVLIQWLL